MCFRVLFVVKIYIIFLVESLSLRHIFYYPQSYEIMKTKKRFLLSLAMALLPFANVYVNAFAGEVPLQVRIEDPNIDKPADPKSPILIPEVSLEDYTLNFDASCLGCELRLLDEDGVLVYSTTITSGTLVLPSYLSGNYELQIIRGNFCFYGDISL